jgi:hypothetical protein
MWGLFKRHRETPKMARPVVITPEIVNGWPHIPYEVTMELFRLYRDGFESGMCLCGLPIVRVPMNLNLLPLGGHASHSIGGAAISLCVVSVRDQLLAQHKAKAA